jgi:hypothetical protein
VGLRVNVPIAGLAGLASAQRVELSLTLGSLPPGAASAQAPDFFVGDDLDANGLPEVRVARLEGGYYRIRYSDETTIVIDARGSAIWACGPASATIEDTATYLLGPVLGFVLRLRGTTCLHASAVAIDGRAVVFVGPAEAGKSSTAAAFARRGHAVLADDVAPLADRGDRFEVQPGYPRLRLWPDSVESLFGARDALPRITPGWDKRYLDLNGPAGRFQHEPLELAAVYILGTRLEGAHEALITPLDARTALMSLVGQTCAGRLLDRKLRAQEFELLGRLVDSVPVRRLEPADDFARVARLCEQVLDDFAGLRARTR